MITDEQVTLALQQFGDQSTPDTWSLPSELGWVPYRTERARMIVKAYLILGVPIDGTITAAALLALAERIEAIEARVYGYGIPAL